MYCGANDILVCNFDALLKARQQLAHLKLEYWKTHSFGTLNWWVLLACSILGWTAWWLLVNKSRLPEILMYGLFVLIVSTIMDGIGVELGFWAYPVKLLPTFARFIPVDFVGMPVFYMLAYQYCHSQKSFTVAMAVMAGVFAFGFEPLCEWLGIYRPLHWEHMYSFPSFIVLGLCLRWLNLSIWEQRQIHSGTWREEA